MYMTSALRKSDVKAVGLQIALELMHEKKNKDVITGLKVLIKQTTNQNASFKTRDWLSANQGPELSDSVGSRCYNYC